MKTSRSTTVSTTDKSVILGSSRRWNLPTSCSTWAVFRVTVTPVGTRESYETTKPFSYKRTTCRCVREKKCPNIPCLYFSASIGPLAILFLAVHCHLAPLLFLEPSWCFVLYRYRNKHCIGLQTSNFSPQVKGKRFSNTSMASILDKILAGRLKRRQRPTSASPLLPAPPRPADHDSDNITQSWIWQRIADFMRPHDHVIVESGTAQFGMPDAFLPPDVTYITQIYYGSIGYSVGCCLGVALAQKELPWSA